MVDFDFWLNDFRTEFRSFNKNWHIEMKQKLNYLSFTFTFVFIIQAATVNAQIIFKEPLSPRIANYKISATLDADKKIIDGKEMLRWKNTSPDTITELQFHLYLNAFKNTNSTFMKESGGQLRGISSDISQEISWGYIDINSIKYIGGNDLTRKIKFIQPDDNNKDDQTVISVLLEKPLKPNEEIQLEINFKSKLPKIFARTGFAENYFLVGQWFPKIGVYEYPGIRYAQKGEWNCHQFHANSEFYADFAVYDVSITLPKKFIVGAVGVLQSKINNNDETATYHYRAEDVVDFAWTASPNFQVVNDQWQNVKIKLMIQPEHFTQAARHLKAVRAALDYFDKYLGKYPYTTITVVDPPLNGIGSAGMEYPSFITAGTLWGLPESIKMLEMVTVHEFGHNYFMGLLASNEFEEAFLDEGFNQYFETRIMDYTYGEKTSALNLFGYKVGDFELTRQGYVGLKNPKLAEIFRKSWDYTNGGYGSFTYNKTAVMLKTLEGLVGIGTMNEIMKTYYQRWKFKHPCVKDFIAIVNEVVIKNHGRKFGDDMNWYFDQVLFGSDVCDYKLASISNQEIKNVIGLIDKNGKRDFQKRKDEKSGNYKSIIIVHRIGEVKLPVEVLVHFNNGKEVIEKWDGQTRTKEFKYEGKNKIIWAKIDPFNKIPLDINVVNNSLTTEPESGVFVKYAVKFLFWAQNVMLSFSMLF